MPIVTEPYNLRAICDLSVCMAPIVCHSNIQVVKVGLMDWQSGRLCEPVGCLLNGHSRPPRPCTIGGVYHRECVRPPAFWSIGNQYNPAVTMATTRTCALMAPYPCSGVLLGPLRLTMFTIPLYGVSSRNYHTDQVLLVRKTPCATLIFIFSFSFL